MKRIALCFLQDDKGNYSHARLIALLVGFSATIFMWKLVVNGELTEDYFFYYLAYGVVHMNVSKSLDVLNNFLGRRNEDRVAGDGRGASSPKAGDGRGRPDGAPRKDIRDSDDGAGRKTEGIDEE